MARGDLERARLPPDPRVLAMLLCEHAHKHEDTGRHSLLGLFDRVVVNSVPAAQRPFAVFVSLTNLHGSYALTVQIVRAADDLEIARVHLQGRVTRDDPLRTETQVFHVPGGTTVPSFGVYLVRLLANGRTIHERKYDVVPP